MRIKTERKRRIQGRRYAAKGDKIKRMSVKRTKRTNEGRKKGEEKCKMTTKRNNKDKGKKRGRRKKTEEEIKE